MEIRTDLALEEKERFDGQEKEISGVTLDEKMVADGAIKVSRVRIINRHGEKAMKKPMGNYITLEVENMGDNEQTRRAVTDELADTLHELINQLNCKQMLVVGLGNRDATPDALGPMVASKINVCDRVCVISPGVMAQTGMETLEYIKAIVNEIKPDMVMAIDALAARNTRRLNSTIQIADTGICPGSGVGNHRKELSEKTLGVPVIAIGVPTVVDAATIVGDAMNNIIDAISEEENDENLRNMGNNMIQNLIEPWWREMYVTPKDVDENVRNISKIISDAINKINQVLV